MSGTKTEVERLYRQGGCSGQGEFIEKAVPVYCGYLQSKYAGDFLPKNLSETLEVSSVCSVTVSANCFSSRLLSKTSATFELAARRIFYADFRKSGACNCRYFA